MLFKTRKVHKDYKYPSSPWRREVDATTSYRFTVLDFSKVQSPMVKKIGV